MHMKKTLVIVEDEPNIAKAEKLILEELYNVHIANDGEVGLSKIREIIPDLVVLDVMMPKISGFEVCKAIRSDKRLSEVKIVMVTAKNQNKDEQTGLDLGADDYIMKPFEPEELLHVINQTLSS